ncbi:MAG TPA: hypothetical protein PK213_14475 [Deltaproteobacteria bacterium]|jgi:hypothetical protein|nr:hypothetical protein [Deltaproteobacteria bacterium]
MKAGLKYCGGCRPDYDRTAAVKDIVKELGEGFELTGADDEESDLIIVVTGCKTACVDTSKLPDKPVRFISSLEDAQRFKEDMKNFLSKER